MKFIGKKTHDLIWLILSLIVFCACDSKHTLIEAFLQNGVETKLFTYGGTSANLGKAVALSGEVALIGGSSAYLYRRDGATWTKDANLRAGFSVALSGSRAVVGREGSVHVHRYNGSQWQEEATITPSDGTTNYEFGYAVSMSESVIAVGANDDYDFGSFPKRGLVYIYRLNGSNWVEEAKFAAGSGAGNGNDGFGYSVCVDGNMAIVGAWGIDAGFGKEDAGAAYVYRFTGSSWQEEAKLTASDAEPYNLFGRAVAVSGNVAVVGAPYDDANIQNGGSAYIYRYNGSNWRQEAKLSFTDTTSSMGAYFGWAVAVKENVVIIGTPFEEEIQYFNSRSSPGCAYVYRWDGSVWREQKKLAASDGTAYNRFGAAVSISGRLAIVGAPGYAANGAAYVYELD